MLFAIHKSGIDEKFAIVHLTWKEKKELKGWPRTHFYNDFDNFKNSKMYPDKADWED